MLIKSTDVFKFNEGTEKALDEVKKKLKLPLNGYMVFPCLYWSRKCFHMTGKAAAEYKSLGLRFAGGLFLLGGPHMYFINKGIDSNWINLFFGLQIALFLLYMYKRHSYLRKAKPIALEIRPLELYTEYLSHSIARGLLAKLIFNYLLIMGPVCIYLAYSLFIGRYYLLFIFIVGAIFWLSALVMIFSIALRKSYSHKQE